jgi:hypothetical protein
MPVRQHSALLFKLAVHRTGSSGSSQQVILDEL